MMQNNNRRLFLNPFIVISRLWQKHKYPIVRTSTLTASAPVLCSALMTTNPISGLLGFGIFFLLWGMAVSWRS